MSASVDTTTAPVIKTEEEVKPNIAEPTVEVTPAPEVTPATEPAVESAKVEEPAKETEIAATEVPATQTDAPAEATTEAATEEAKLAEPAGEKRPKSPSILSKLLAPFKGGKVKSPKSEKKKLEAEPTPAVTEETPVAAPAPEVEGAVAAAAVAEEAAIPEIIEPVKETEIAPVTETEAAPAPVTDEIAEPIAEAKEEEKPKKVAPAKVGRRLSARVGDFFKSKPKSSTEPTSPKVEEEPPKIEESTPIAPLENPATEIGPVVDAKEETEAPTVIEQTKEEPKPENTLAGPSLAVTAAA